MNQQKNAPKKENMWNAILNEQSSSKGFPNTNLLMLGRKNAGKRSLIDAITDISKTQYPKKSLNFCTIILGQQDMQAGKMKQKGSATLLDYTYLNVLDLNDPDNITNARLNVYMFEEDFQRGLINLVLNEKQLQHTMVAIALDLQEPWTFMDDLNRWIDTLSEALSKVKVNLKTMDQMRQKVEVYARNFQEVQEKDPESTHRLDEEIKEVARGPLREGILRTNLGIPIIVFVTKSDIIEQAEKDKDWDQKFEAILFSLRQFCLTYGATLIFTSQKSNTNLNIFYEYILHRMYDAPLRHKSDTSNGESLFIPIGIEDASILKSLYTKFSNDLAYEEKVPMPASKKANREELTVEDNQELFKRLKEKQGTSGTSGKASLQINASIEKTEDGPLSQRGQITTPSGGQSKQNEQLQSFYSKILQPQPAKPDQNQMKESAKEELFSRMKGKSETIAPVKSNPLFNADDKAKIQNIIKFSQPPVPSHHKHEDSNRSDQKIQSMLTAIKKPDPSETDNKIKNILNLAKPPPSEQQQQQG